MDGTTILLRLIHILAGIFWVGGVFVIAGFLVPTVRELGPQGGRFMQHLAQRRRLPVVLGIAGLLTVLSGLAMYVRLAAVGQTASTAGPSAEQQAEMGRLQQRIALGSRLTAVLLAVAAGAMAVARYL